MTPVRCACQQEDRGSALIVTYWIVALLSLLVFGAAQLLFSEFSVQSMQGARARAGQLAEMGLAIAAHPQIGPGDPALGQKLTDVESFLAGIEAEEGRLNLNAILQRRDTEVLQRLLELWGMRPEEASPVVSTLLDWVDSDDLTSPGGAERTDYQRAGLVGAPPNRRLLALGEIGGLPGVRLLASLRPDWEEVFTLFGSGKLALDDASAEAICVACACSLDSARQFVELRRGRDGLENTADDVVLQSVEEVMNLLDVTVGEREAAMGRVTLKGSTLRLRSEGRMGESRVEKWLVVDGRGPGMRILAAGNRVLPAAMSP